MSYTTFLGDIFEDEHDEELTRKFGDTYKFFKKDYPKLYKLPTEDVQGIFNEFKKSPYGDTFEKSVERTKQYIKQHMPEWQKKYLNSPKQTIDNLQPVIPETNDYTFQMTTPNTYPKFGTESDNNTETEINNKTSDPEVYQHHLYLSGFPNNNWEDKTNFNAYFPNPIRKNINKNPLINDCIDSPRYQEFITKTERREGIGLANVEEPTMTGIRQSTLNDILHKYPSFRGVYPENIKDLTQDQWRNIYCQEYYKLPHGELINHPRLRDMILDQNVMRDRTKFVKNLQQMLNNYGITVEVDGVLGSQTVNILNSLKDPDDFVDYAKEKLPDFLSKKPEYQNGWKNRIKKY